jgi:cytochrome oxidase assembly protein ShyY1
VLTGFVDLTSEDPAAAQPLQPANKPVLSDGPHFFYALQWWFFALMAIGGYIYLLIDERRKIRSAGTQQPTVDGDGSTGDE